MSATTFEELLVALESDDEFAAALEADWVGGSILDTLPIYVRAMQPGEPEERRRLALHRVMKLYLRELDKAGGDNAKLDSRLRLLEAQVDHMWRGEPLLAILADVCRRDRATKQGKNKSNGADPHEVAILVQEAIDADPRPHGAKARAFRKVGDQVCRSETTVRNIYYANGGEEGARHSQRAKRINALIEARDGESRTATNDEMEIDPAAVERRRRETEMANRISRFFAYARRDVWYCGRTIDFRLNPPSGLTAPQPS
jgi:hypothetical protein